MNDSSHVMVKLLDSVDQHCVGCHR
jgi:hypothetical protein